MKSSIFRYSTTFLLLLIISETVFPGGWTQKRQGYYLKFSANYLDTATEYNHLGEQLDLFAEQFAFEDASFRDLNLTIYGEYGITDRFTVIGNLPIKVLRTKRTEVIGGRAARILTLYSSGLSDLTLSGRLRLLQNPLALSFQGGLKIPLGYEQQPENEAAPLGTGNADLEGHFQFGKGFSTFPGYLTGSLGYRYRGGPLNDQIVYLLEAGINLPSRGLFKLTLDGIQSTVTPPDIAGQTIDIPLPGGGGARPNVIVGDQNIWKISPSLIFNIERGVSIQLEMLNVFAGKNTLAGSAWSAGLVFQK